MDQFFRRFFGEQGAPFGDQGSPFNTPSTPRGPSPRQRQFTERGLGSGVIIDAKEGYVLTNYHVVAGADKTEVRMPDGKTLVVEWARTDPMSDLAVLKVKGDNFSEVPLGDSDAIQVGDWVLAIGSPEGLPQTVTSGIISAKGRSTGEAATYQSFLQTDAAINHGNSGGPLVNMHGEVVGITTAIVSESGGNEGIGFAIPSNMAKTVMTQLIKTGKVVRGYLGVAIQAADEDIKESFHLPTTAGALVAGVTPDSPAAKAGLKKGDFITTVDGTKVDNVNDLRNLVAGLPPGKVATIELYRDGKKMTVEATIQAQPANFLTAAGGQTPQETPGQPATADRFGLEVASPTAELAQPYGYKTPPAGVIITNVVSGSPAEEKGLRDGMAITEVGNQAVNSADEFKKAISSEEAAKSVRLYVTNPAGAEHIVVLKPKE
jgi:serine protease Do